MLRVRVLTIEGLDGGAPRPSRGQRAAAGESTHSALLPDTGLEGFEVPSLFGGTAASSMPLSGTVFLHARLDSHAPGPARLLL